MLLNETDTGAVQHVKAADQCAEQQEQERYAVSQTQKETKAEQHSGSAEPDKQKLVHPVPCAPAKRGKTAPAFAFRFFLKNLFHIVNPILWFRNIPLYIIVYHLHAKKQPRF